MVDCCGRVDEFNRHPLAIIPNDQIETLKFMVGNSDVNINIESIRLKNGDAVRITSGHLCELEGFVHSYKSDQAHVFVKLNNLGCASMMVSRQDIELM